MSVYRSYNAYPLLRAISDLEKLVEHARTLSSDNMQTPAELVKSLEGFLQDSLSLKIDLHNNNLHNNSSAFEASAALSKAETSRLSTSMAMCILIFVAASSKDETLKPAVSAFNREYLTFEQQWMTVTDGIKADIEDNRQAENSYLERDRLRRRFRDSYTPDVSLAPRNDSRHFPRISEDRYPNGTLISWRDQTPL